MFRILCGIIASGIAAIAQLDDRYYFEFSPTTSSNGEVRYSLGEGKIVITEYRLWSYPQRGWHWSAVRRVTPAEIQARTAGMSDRDRRDYLDCVALPPTTGTKGSDSGEITRHFCSGGSDASERKVWFPGWIVVMPAVLVFGSLAMVSPRSLRLKR